MKHSRIGLRLHVAAGPDHARAASRLEGEIKWTRSQHRRGVFERLSGSTQKAIRCIYRANATAGMTTSHTIYGKMANFEVECWAWMIISKRVDRLTAITTGHAQSTRALTSPSAGCWSPPGTCRKVKQLPSFPDALANWASEQFDEDRACTFSRLEIRHSEAVWRILQSIQE